MKRIRRIRQACARRISQDTEIQEMRIKLWSKNADMERKNVKLSEESPPENLLFSVCRLQANFVPYCTSWNLSERENISVTNMKELRAWPSTK
jgi:hypothetical protein